MFWFSALDIAALVWLGLCWASYAWMCDRSPRGELGLMKLVHSYRERWLQECVARDNPMVDAALVSNLMRSVSFFASTSILILGGLLTALGYAERAMEVTAELPLAKRTSAAIWETAFAKANSPTTYLALTAMTGANEAWFLVPFASHAAMEEDSKRNAATPALTAELEGLSRADAEVISEVRTMQLRARPDLSMGSFPNLAKVRYYDVTWLRVRIGQEQSFEAAFQAWVASAKRNAPTTSYRAYELVAGGVSSTYLIFTSAESYAEFDRLAADGQKIWMGMTPEEGAVMQKGLGGMVNMETQHFRVDPAMSYVDKCDAGPGSRLLDAEEADNIPSW